LLLNKKVDQKKKIEINQKTIKKKINKKIEIKINQNRRRKKDKDRVQALVQVHNQAQVLHLLVLHHHLLRQIMIEEEETEIEKKNALKKIRAEVTKVIDLEIEEKEILQKIADSTESMMITKNLKDKIDIEVEAEIKIIVIDDGYREKMI
jgi:hypothetical protein